MTKTYQFGKTHTPIDRRNGTNPNQDKAKYTYVTIGQLSSCKLRTESEKQLARSDVAKALIFGIRGLGQFPQNGKQKYKYWQEMKIF